MPEITRENFQQKYSKIIDDLQSATFVSIDCEFSGLIENNSSLFDSPADRYTKLRNGLKFYKIIQIGLSTFQYDRLNNKVNSKSYCFYLFPSSFFNMDTNITCEINSLKFLCKHGFNFNKLIHSGISYLNEGDEQKILKMIDNRITLSKETYHCECNDYCSKIFNWNIEAHVGSELLLTVNNEQEDCLTYLLHFEIRRKFEDLWTFHEQPKVIKIKKITESERKELEADTQEEIIIKKKLFHSILGFSKVMKELKNLKKPIVGHNMLIDLIMIYKQFFGSLPASYQKFKENITNIFPHVYDTKYCSYLLRKHEQKTHIWNSNSLTDLYEYFKRGKGTTLVMYMPVVINQEEEYVESGKCHEAGVDSYYTGFCFIKMAYMFSNWDSSKNTFKITTMPRSSSWLLSNFAGTKNHINFARGKTNCIILDGPDPISIQPALLLMKPKNNKKANFLKIVDEIAKYTAVDFKPFDRSLGLLAVKNQMQAKNILDHFENNEEFTLLVYNFWMHSNLGRTILAAGLVGTITVLAVLTRGLFKIK